jgi:hypothetical protein
MGGGGDGCVAACGAGDSGGGGVKQLRRFVLASTILACCTGTSYAGKNCLDPAFAESYIPNSCVTITRDKNGEKHFLIESYGLPEDKSEVAKWLWSSFSITDPELLAKQYAADELCKFHQCADLSEATAQKVLAQFYALKNQRQDRINSYWSLVLSGIGIVISGLSFWYSFRVDRRAKKQKVSTL